MARSYDGAGNTSAREQVEHGKQLERARNQKIEFGVIIGAAAIAGLSILINTGKCISAANATKDYNAQRVEAEATLEELNAKLQDPSAQNYVYKDPTIGNMKETGQAIAMMQNQIIAANQSHSGLTYNDSTDSGDHVVSTSQTGGGAVTLDPTDLAPSGSETPDSETVEENEATITPDDSSDSDYTYTPISNFDDVPGIGTETNTSVPDTTTAAPVIISDGKDLAQLITDFKKDYFAQQIANVDNVPGTDNTAWSWYGYWEFSGTYDYSVNEVPQMSAVWTCYEPSDVGHLRPLAFVTATYTESTKRFTNPTAYYTQYYVNAAKAQSNAYGSQSNNNSDNVALTPDDQNKNGEGSENDYHLNIVEDDTPNNSNDNDNEGVTLTPNTDTTNPGTTNTQPSDTTQPSNPSGSATWTPGSGATPSSGNNNPGGTGTWNPNGNGTGTGTGTGTWNPSGSSSSSNSGSAGTWVPAK